MSQKILLHDQATDKARAIELEPSTFVVSEDKDGNLTQMTYNEWEALRVEQASEQLKAKLDEAVADEAKRAEAKALLDTLTASLRVKYLEGACSWVQIYTELVDGIARLV